MVKISLPNPNDYSSDNNSPEKAALMMHTFLRQMELGVHHAQKSLEQMEKDGFITADSYILFEFPRVNLSDREQDEKGFVKVHVDDESDAFQDIVISLSA